MRRRRICGSNPALLLLLLCIWMLRPGAAKIHGNPANELVAAVNGKRAASKLRALRTSAGLGCMALQYITECMDAGKACGGDNTVACEPPEAHITEVYAANCGVELPTVDVISGRLVGCCHGDGELPLPPSPVIRGKEHTQVGAGVDRARRRGPFFWCLLFSSGSANSTFQLEAAGKGIHQTHGCFSAPDRLSCSATPPPPTPTIGAVVVVFLLPHLPFLLLH
ncbi:hypothetical protein ACP4OV_000001 [Aristida adscensionis]